MKSTRKLSLSIIGGGNVAFHLANTLWNDDRIEVKQLCNRSGFTFDFEHITTSKVTDFSQLELVDICIIAVKDEAITAVSERLPFGDTLVVHTSGNTDINAISSKNRKGVFYPLQSFSKSVPVDFQNIPICIEAQNKTDLEKLHILASILTTKIYEINSFQRRILHISAVFVNNFTNHLVTLGEEICRENNIPFEILTPLLMETFEKLQKIAPFDAQTGPARRSDIQTIENHLKLLQGSKKEIYKNITNSILDTYGRKKL
ncbi:MAG: DUF2520 domain-containing protein [Capnocytophaga sp.]|nr:DUF2520 domain-containing protein [Capnocytophaga sp.]